jgi:hypothetical protein
MQHTRSRHNKGNSKGNSKSRFTATNATFAVSMIISVILLLVLSGCRIEKAPPNDIPDETAQDDTQVPENVPAGECQKNDDCTAVFASRGMTATKCQIPTCISNMCAMDTKAQCCGNGLLESTEDGRPGNKCTCPADHGICEPAVSFETARGTFYEAKYFRRTCNSENSCVTENVNELQRNNEFFNSFTGTGFTLNIYVKYKTPFDKGNSQFDVEFKLSQLDPTQVQPPISINEIRIMDGTNVLVRASPVMTFNNVLDTADYNLVINDYSIVYPEEIKTVTLSIDYEYTPLVQKNDENGTLYYDPGIVQRQKYDTSIQEIPFLDKTLLK